MTMLAFAIAAPFIWAAYYLMFVFTYGCTIGVRQAFRKGFTNIRA